MTAVPTIDTTRPNAARMYDAMLGGYHNFEPDRAAVARLTQVLPTTVSWARMNRCFLQVVSQQLAASGLRHFIDLATGLPTQGYIHEVLPEAKVLYSDIDPVTVAYARDMLAGNANVQYLSSDAVQPEGLLESPELRALFGDERRVGIFCIGISYFLSREQLSRTLDVLYRWAAPGSALAISVIAEPPTGFPPGALAVQDQYRAMGVKLFYHKQTELNEIVDSWKVGEQGWCFLHEWPGIDADDIFSPQELAEGGMRGAILWK